jgi:hypothetical protein
MSLTRFSFLALLAGNCFVSRPVACNLHPHYHMHCLLSSTSAVTSMHDMSHGTCGSMGTMINRPLPHLPPTPTPPHTHRHTLQAFPPPHSGMRSRCRTCRARMHCQGQHGRHAGCKAASAQHRSHVCHQCSSVSVHALSLGALQFMSLRAPWSCRLSSALQFISLSAPWSSWL